MQRKNNILRKSKHSYRSGMAMIMAIAVIVIMAGIMAISLSMTATTTKKTKDLYLYEQSILLSKSATEFALLQIAQNQPCSDLNVTFPQDTIYIIDIDMQYIYHDDPNTGPNEAQVLCNANGGTLYTSVQTPEQNGSVVMDITVSVTDPTITAEPIRYFRRTIQKL